MSRGSATALTVRQRVEFRIARWLSLMSPRTQVRLSGRPPVRIDGLTLEPEIQLMLSIIEREGRPPFHELTPPEARLEIRRSSQVAGGPPPPVAAVRDLTVGGAQGPLRARHYAPDEPGGPHPLIVLYHGGGFVIGDLESHDVPCRLLTRSAGAHVLSVDYRLAPEHRFPAAVDDARAALAWAFEHAEALGADPARIAVAGDSAGGNLAAVTSWRAASDGGPSPVLQLLIYPVTDFAERARSHALFHEGFLLTRRDMDWFEAHYRAEADPHDPRLSIGRAEDLSGVAPAIVATAGFDPLRDEGEAFARRLRDAGVPTVLRRFPGLVHGFINVTGLSRVSRDATVELGGVARAMLAGVRVASGV